MLEFKDLSLSFKNRILIDGFSAILKAGSLVALLGRNGSGKSTLLRQIASVEANSKASSALKSGSILLNGKDISRLSAKELSRNIAYMSSQRIRIDNLSCYTLVSLGRSPYTNWRGKMQEKDEKFVREALSMVGMQDFASTPINRLSDGEYQRIMISRALAQDTKIILMDEPTSFLDLPSRIELCNLLFKLSEEQNKLIIFSTHELDLALKHCREVLLIDGGKAYFAPSDQGALKEKIETAFFVAS